MGMTRSYAVVWKSLHQEIVLSRRSQNSSHALCAGPVKGATLIKLAFETLGQYEFAYKPKYLEPVKMLGYLDDENETIRNSAAHAFCQIMHRNAKSQNSARLQRSKSGTSFPSVVYKVRICHLPIFLDAMQSKTHTFAAEVGQRIRSFPRLGALGLINNMDLLETMNRAYHVWGL